MFGWLVEPLPSWLVIALAEKQLSVHMAGIRGMVEIRKVALGQALAGPCGFRAKGNMKISRSEEACKETEKIK